MYKRTDHKRDEALKETFPASDPPASSGITGASGDTHAGEPTAKPSNERSMDERPTGTPTSDRHATETAHTWEHQQHGTGGGR